MSTAERATRSTAARARRSTVARTIAGTVAVLSSLMLPVAPVLAADVPTEPSSSAVCAPEEVRWSGSLTLTDGETWTALGVEVPARLGTWLEVVGTSADGIDAAGRAHPLPVAVGGATVATGSRVDGGAVAVTGVEGIPVTVTGVTVALQRCAEVASAVPAQGAPSTGAPAAAAPADLPDAGTSSVWIWFVGAAAVSAGAVLVLTTNRRRHPC